MRRCRQRNISTTGSGRSSWCRSIASTREPPRMTTRPGTPTTVQFGGTSSMTTAPPPTLLPWPTVMSPSTVAPTPTTTQSSQRGVPLAVLLAGAAERDALVERDVVADDRRLADDHAHAVVDEEALADGGAGVDLDAGEEARDLGEPAREARDARDSTASASTRCAQIAWRPG